MRISALCFLALIISTLTVPSALAQEFAGGDRSTQVDQFFGQQRIRTNPTERNGVGFVHPVQVQVDYQESFVAVGTAKGSGVDNCPDEYSGSWEVYVDGVKPSGTYFCRTISTNEYTAGDNVNFTIQHKSCGWQLFFGGKLRDCITAPAYASTGVRMAVSLEETPTVPDDFNIDVRYFQLEYANNGGPVRDMIPSVINSPGYTTNIIGPRRIDAYFGVLN